MEKRSKLFLHQCSVIFYVHDHNFFMSQTCVQGKHIKYDEHNFYGCPQCPQGTVKKKTTL